MSPIPLVTVGWIHPILEILEEVDAPYENLLQKANLPILAVDDGSVLVPTGRIYQFVDLAAKETGMKDLGLRAGSRLSIEPLLPDAERSWSRPGEPRVPPGRAIHAGADGAVHAVCRRSGLVS